MSVQELSNTLLYVFLFCSAGETKETEKRDLSLEQDCNAKCSHQTATGEARAAVGSPPSERGAAAMAPATPADQKVG